jgi:hypothetical protein
MHRFTSGDAAGERVISSYAQWLYQRPWLAYQTLAGRDREAADRLLGSVGGLAALNTAIPHWVQRRKGQLELVAAQHPGSLG